MTAFANTGSGTLIYGRGEIQRDGRSYAGDISPVRDARMRQDRSRDIIASNIDPELHGFPITYIPADGGSIFIVKAEEGDNSYQNTCDQEYCGRIAASAQPMHGFAVREVVNRRTRPHITPSFRAETRGDRRADQREYVLLGELKNERDLTAQVASCRTSWID